MYAFLNRMTLQTIGITRSNTFKGIEICEYTYHQKKAYQ